MKAVNLGFDNVVMAAQIVAVAGASSAAMRRLKEDARKNHKLIDVTNGRKTRTVVITASGHVITSSLQPQTLAQRINQAR